MEGTPRRPPLWPHSICSVRFVVSEPLAESSLQAPPMVGYSGFAQALAGCSKPICNWGSATWASFCRPRTYCARISFVAEGDFTFASWGARAAALVLAAMALWGFSAPPVLSSSGALGSPWIRNYKPTRRYVFLTASGALRTSSRQTWISPFDPEGWYLCLRSSRRMWGTSEEPQLWWTSRIFYCTD